MLRAIDKDPNAVLPYRFDWTDWLDGDTILNSSVTVSPAEASGVKIDEQTHDAKVVTVWLSGGVAGQTYTVTCSVFPTSGAAHNMRDDRSILVRVKER